MSPERWQYITDTFVEASRLESENRRLFLIERCGDDADMRREVESLLTHSRPADSLFDDTPLWSIVPGESSDFAAWIGHRIGRYQLVRLLSTGGMGVVFLAEQDNPRRHVAVKLLPRGILFGAAHRRFEFEAEILGRLRHPCIAEIYEAGRSELKPPSEYGPSGAIHYFAMEYVEGGQDLLAFAREHKLTMKDKIKLFVRICDGVQHGHQNGIIHRDLKPSNVLVTVDERATGKSVPLPKIIDFGVAKCTDSDFAVTTLQTSAGEIIGTLQYMSPEQCGCDTNSIDTRADVYSLGVLLYQLITDHVPYDVSNLTIQSAVRIITEEDPLPPSRYDRRFGGDLETVLLKALSKKRDERYASAGDLSQELSRYLNGQPIEASRTTRWVRTMRWIMRHPRISASLASLAISSLIVGVTLLSIWLLNAQPYRLELTSLGRLNDFERARSVERGDRAVLSAFSGKELHNWKTDRYGISLAALAERPEKWGGGKVVILGFSILGATDYGGHRICIVDAQQPDQLIKAMTVEQAAINAMQDEWPRPPEEPTRVYHTDGFSVKCAWVLDIFPDEESPGQEIVAVHQFEHGSQCVLRIYNLAGELLFQAWQDGGIEDIRWLSKPGLLVCNAIKGDRSGGAYGIKDLEGHPWVLFAVKPKKGLISNGWILPEAPNPKLNPRFDGDQWEGEWFRPEWYKTTCPAKWASVFAVDTHLRASFISDYPSDSYVKIMYKFHGISVVDDNPYSLALRVGPDGSIAHRPLESDSVQAVQVKEASLPTRHTLNLVDWTEARFPCFGEEISGDTPPP